jgi:hypothetical protein
VVDGRFDEGHQFGPFVVGQAREVRRIGLVGRGLDGGYLIGIGSRVVQVPVSISVEFGSLFASIGEDHAQRVGSRSAGSPHVSTTS